MKDIVAIENITFNESQQNLTAKFSIDFKNPLFEGHFPKQPVLPGVMELEIIEKTLKSGLKKNLLLKNIVQVKFLKTIRNTDENNEYFIDIKVEYIDKENLICKSTIFNSHLTQIHMKACFRFLINHE